MRIGVVTDTHVGEHLPVLPQEVGTALAGVDLIIHAGDLTDPSVLDALHRVAPVVAVRGNHDHDAGHRDLPEHLLVRAGGARIGVTQVHTLITDVDQRRHRLYGFQDRLSLSSQARS